MINEKELKELFTIRVSLSDETLKLTTKYGEEAKICPRTSNSIPIAAEFECGYHCCLSDMIHYLNKKGFIDDPR